MKLPIAFVLCFTLFACHFSKPESGEKEKSTHTAKSTQIEFQNEIYNFGTLEAGEIAMYSFLFENTGKYDLWINSIDAGCGCLQIDYPRKPVKPGEKGNITVEFNSSGLYGKQMKTIKVLANVPEIKHLTIFAGVNNEQINFK